MLKILRQMLKQCQSNGGSFLDITNTYTIVSYVIKLKSALAMYVYLQLFYSGAVNTDQRYRVASKICCPALKERCFFSI